MPLDQSVRAEVVKNIIKFEKNINHFYLDSVGKVTVGIGHLIPNKMAVRSVVMYKRINMLPGAVANLQEKQKRGYRAEWYAKHSTLIMKDKDIKALLNKHVDSFYRELTTIYSKAKGYQDDFDNFDKYVQAAIFDMIFNLGAHKITANFPNFDKALKAGDWRKAAYESNRHQLNVLRNSYVKNKFLAAASKAAKKKVSVKP